MPTPIATNMPAVLPARTEALSTRESTPGANIDDAARFAALMAAPPTAPTSPTPPSTPSPTDDGTTVTGPSAVAPAHRSIGHHILDSLQDVSTNLQQNWNTITDTLANAPSLSTRQIMSMQMAIQSMSVQYELIGKVVSRSTQNIDQLVKLQ